MTHMQRETRGERRIHPAACIHMVMNMYLPERERQIHIYTHKYVHEYTYVYRHAYTHIYLQMCIYRESETNTPNSVDVY